MRAGSIPTLPSYLVGPQNGMVLWLDAAKQVGINDAGILSPCAFDAADWTKARCSVTANAAADPWGATTADSLVEDASLNTHPIQQATTNVVAGIPFTASVYAKAGARSWAILSVNGGAAGVSFNLSTGAVGSSFGAATGTMLSVGSGWYLISVSHAVALANSVVIIYPATADSTNNYQGDGVSNILIDGCSVSQPKVNLWVDQSGAGNNVIQVTAAKQPLWKPNGAGPGLPCVTGDGVDDVIGPAAFALAEPHSMYLVYKSDVVGAPGADVVVDGNLSVTGGTFLTDTTPRYYIYSGIGVFSTTSNTSFAQITGEYNGASSALRQNRAQIATGNSGGVAAGGITLFASGGAASRWTNSSVCEVIRYNKLHGALDRQEIESYLARKWLRVAT